MNNPSSSYVYPDQNRYVSRNRREKVPSFTKPRIVGYMSVDVSRQYHRDLSQLKYITHIPTSGICFDLNHKINEAVKRTTEDNVEKITLMLKWLVDEKFPTIITDQNESPTFITYRRTFISVMTNACGYCKPLSIMASLYNGHIYLCSLETPQDISRRKSRTSQEKLFCAWGYKFEQFMVADRPSLKPNIERPVIENEEFSMYYTAKFGDHNILYCAQIDGMLATSGRVEDPPTTVDSNIILDYLRNKKFVELKTNREIQNGRQEENFKKYKLLTCWCQCYLAGLEGVIVGFRNDEGIVRKLEYFNTGDIVQYCKHVWRPETGLDFLNYFLSYVKNYFRNYEKKDNGPITLQFNIDGTKIKVNENYDKDCEILPDWYIAAVNK